MHYNSTELLEPMWMPLPTTISPSLRSWLLEEKSLTQRMREYGDVQIKVLAEYWSRGLPSEYALLNVPDTESLWHRDVVITVNNKSWMAARTCIPHNTLEHLDSLKNLGNHSLGDLIFAKLNGNRNKLEYASLSPKHVLYQLAKNEIDWGEPLWGRRSVLQVNEKSLLLNEVFFPIMGEITRKSL